MIIIVNIYGKLIKSWVYKKTLFYLIKTKQDSVPIMLSAYDISDVHQGKNGSFKCTISPTKYRTSRGMSKNYFAEEEALKSQEYTLDMKYDQGSPVEEEATAFPEYDPYNEDSYLDIEDDIEMVGYEEQILSPPDAGGVEIPDFPEDILPDTNIPKINPPLADYSDSRLSDKIRDLEDEY